MKFNDFVKEDTKSFGVELQSYHGGMMSAIYKVSSSIVAGKKVPSYLVDDAIKELKDEKDKEFDKMAKKLEGMKSKISESVSEVKFSKKAGTYKFKDSKGNVWDRFEKEGITWYIRKIDDTHVAMTTDIKSEYNPATWHVGQLKGNKEFYNHLLKFVAGEEALGGKIFEAEMKTAIFKTKYKELEYWTDPSSKTTVACDDLKKAKAIIKNSKVPDQKLTTENNERSTGMKYSNFVNEKKVKYSELIDLRTEKGIKKAEELKKKGWKIASHGIDTIQFYKEDTITEALKNKIDISKIKDDIGLIADIDKHGKEGTDYELVGSTLKYSDKLKSFVDKYVKEASCGKSDNPNSDDENEDDEEKKKKKKDKENGNNDETKKEGVRLMKFGDFVNEQENGNGGVNVQNIIDELISTGWSGDNKSQMKAVQLLKGLATSDDPKANDFMKKLDDFTSGMKSE